ncbi:MAG: hypothetical protein WC666_02420 [Candidatus Paceibacterota bacterium]|jgi:hypothetical protein
MSTSYPRKQTAFILLICIIAVTAVAFYVHNTSVKNEPLNIQPAIVNTDEKQDETIVVNTDWKKTFFDIGTSTGSFKTPAKATKTPTIEKNLTPTDILGMSFFSKYVELRQLGLNNDPQAIDAFSSQIIADSMANIAKPKVYSSKDIQIISAENNIVVVKSYAETLMNIFKLGMPEKNEAEIAMNAFEKGDMTLLKDIDPIILGYQSTLNRLISTPVPQPIAQYHLDLLNALSLQMFNAKSLRNSETDPVTALAAVSMEVKSLQAISEAIAGMQNYFTTSGIVFVLPVSGSILQSK